MNIFESIIAGKTPCYKIAETDKFLAFLDVFPSAIGHTLLIPKQSIDSIFDLEDNILAEMQILAKKISHALQKTFNTKRVGLIVAGFEVPHAHIHLIPANDMKALQFQEKMKFSPEQFIDIAQRIKENLDF